MTEHQESHESWTDEQKWKFLLRHERLGELLVSQSLITVAQLENVLREQIKSRNTKHLGEIVVELNLLTLDEIVAALDRQCRTLKTSEQAIQDLKNKNKG